jgi:hypothetical protein
VAGCCQPRVVTQQCTAQGQACTGDNWSTDTFFCDTTANQCLARCDSTTTDAAQANSCARGSWCFQLTDPSQQTSTLDGACAVGDCNNGCFSPADCPDGTPFACDDGNNNGTCYAFGNGASFCLTGGDQGAGDSCVPGSTNASELCNGGLFCFNGTCEAACAYDSQHPEAGCDSGECVPVFDQTGTNKPGLCGQACDPFSRGQCPDGQGCEPEIGAFSGQLTSWFCANLLADVPVVGEGESCDADGSDGYSNQCGEGLQCVVNFTDDTEGTCLKVCDFTLTDQSDSARCTAAAPGMPVLVEGEAAPYAQEGDTLGYLTIDAATNATLQLVEEPAAEGSGETLLDTQTGVNLAEGSANTAIAYLDADGNPAGVGFMDWNDTTDALTENDAGLRVYNVADQDMTVSRVNPVTFTDSDTTVTGFVSVALGTTLNNLYAVGSNYYVFRNVSGAPAAPSVEVVVFDNPDPGTAVIFAPYDDVLPENANTGVSVRLINASQGHQTVDVDWQGVFTAGCDATDVGYTDATEFAFHSLSEASSLSFYVYDPGDTDCGGTQIGDIISLGNVNAGDVLTVLLVDGPTEGSVDTVVLSGTGTPAEGDDVAVRLANVSGDQDIVLELETEETLGTATSLDTLPAADGAVDLTTGDFALAVRAAGTAATSAPDLFSGRSVASADDLLRMVVSNAASGAEAPYVMTLHPESVPDVSSLGAGETMLRLIHAAAGVGGVRLLYPGEATQVCAPLSVEGLGRCYDRCTPYFPGTPYTNESGDPAGRWEQNGCPTDDSSLVYACFPFITTGNEDVPVELDGDPNIDGFCVPRKAADATGGFGDDCTTNGDPSCNPDSWCVGVSTTQAVCTKLCLPFSGNGDSDCEAPNFCYGLSLAQEYGFCFAPDLATATEGDSCTSAQAGALCGGDDTLCIGLSDAQGATTYECRRLCKRGIADTCPDVNGVASTCSDQIQFQGSPPAWFSICVPAQ